MKKSIIVTLILAFLSAATLAFTNNDPIYKNLKILPKDITEKQMDSVMNHFTKSLNVGCDFCHVAGKDDFEYALDDNKHKLIAREMMEMTNEINDKYFDVTGVKRNINTQLMVTCWSCHHGSKMPDTDPPGATQGSKAPLSSKNK